MLAISDDTIVCVEMYGLSVVNSHLAALWTFAGRTRVVQTVLPCKQGDSAAYNGYHLHHNCGCGLACDLQLSLTLLDGWMWTCLPMF